MIGASPETIWGDKLGYVDEKKNRPEGMIYRLKPNATSEEKQKFEEYMLFGNSFFLKEFYPKFKDPYYTWDGKIVERSSLKGRAIPLAKIPDGYKSEDNI